MGVNMAKFGIVNDEPYAGKQAEIIRDIITRNAIIKGLIGRI